MGDTLLRVFGWRFLLVTGDPCVLDRWLWLRSHLRLGARRTFDAGCGNGGFSIFAASIGNQVVAASFSQSDQERARRRADALGVTDIDFRIIDLRELEDHCAALGEFEQIICLETIEHVSDDQALVKSLVAMLNPGGQILLSTPYEGHRPLYTEERHPSSVEDGSHVRYGYSPQRLRRLVEDAGMDVEDESFISGVVSQKLTNLMRRLSARVGLFPAWLIVLPLRLLVILDAPLSRALRYPYLSVALRAVKPLEPDARADDGLSASPRTTELL
jgi:2-polyprenyl-3-methyl-5-hydroxy-6-metoxy-1,4-benzoquinol methylase